MNTLSFVRIHTKDDKNTFLLEYLGPRRTEHNRIDKREDFCFCNVIYDILFSRHIVTKSYAGKSMKVKNKKKHSFNSIWYL